MAKGRWGWKPTTRRLISIAGSNQRGNRGEGNPFLTLGMEWCRVCKQEMDCDTQASHRSGIYVFKRWCLRCGTVLKWGTYAAPMITDKPIPAMAFEWVTKPEQDRR